MRRAARSARMRATCGAVPRAASSVRARARARGSKWMSSWRYRRGGAGIPAPRVHLGPLSGAPGGEALIQLLAVIHPEFITGEQGVLDVLRRVGAVDEQGGIQFGDGLPVDRAVGDMLRVDLLGLLRRSITDEFV